MSAEEVLKAMKGKGWITSRQLINKVSIGRASLMRTLCCLSYHNEIQRKEDNCNCYLYKYGGEE